MESGRGQGLQPLLGGLLLLRRGRRRRADQHDVLVIAAADGAAGSQPDARRPRRLVRAVLPRGKGRHVRHDFAQVRHLLWQVQARLVVAEETRLMRKTQYSIG